MKPSDILAKWRSRLTPADHLRDEIAKHNAEVERKKLHKRQRRAAKALGIAEKVAI